METTQQSDLVKKAPLISGPFMPKLANLVNRISWKRSIMDEYVEIFMAKFWTIFLGFDEK